MPARNFPPARRSAPPARGWAAGPVATAILIASTACIPSFPPCDCGKADEGGFDLEDFPDFEVLDRSEPCDEASEVCPDGDDSMCGYPAGPYGFMEGDTFENLVLFDCEGNQVQMAQYIPQPCTENEAFGVVFAVGAGWCAPCQEEAIEWAADVVDEYPEIQFLQALDEDASNGPMNPGFCAGWSEANASDKFPILYTEEPTSLQIGIGGQPLQPIPYTLIFNANGEIVQRKTGGKLELSVLEEQLDTLLSDPYGN
ncbi:hypothetical protein PPSIR1_34622 [Plesiocystis pacifica SIR-1]|uniref:Thioredoxin domain-containing protein n=1 Tax=Plesiocystis pacifica SIR-1 TaxID=391625 RepID=A6GJY9_9BACT|nr:hypothetical protein [Plesiocystis pacifica]EDM73810.1 hypothetical protein PPSIR1_34622 [Plesiocystis pacifica SIR-1]